MKDDRLNLYKSLFKGREDVFALRWEKAVKAAICQLTVLIRTDLNNICFAIKTL
jgi:hypothetical protein